MVEYLEHPVDETVIGVLHAGGDHLAGFHTGALVNDAEEEVAGGEGI